MSDPVELALREELAAVFSAELGGRVYDLVHPPEDERPVATYRRVGSGGGADMGYSEARVQISLKDDTYTEVKRLQRRIEDYMGSIVNRPLGANERCVWVFRITPVTMPDGYQAATRSRLAVTDLIIKYAG